MDIDESINKLRNILNTLINKNDLKVKTIELSKELLETLKVLGNCKDKKIDENELCEFHKSINRIEHYIAKRKKHGIIDKLDGELFRIDNKLNKGILCEVCKEKEIIKKLTDKYVRWISFSEFRNTEYLAKGDFGKVHKATWINGYYGRKDLNVVLKRIHNSSDKILDILNEVRRSILLILIIPSSLNEILHKFTQIFKE